MTTNVEIGGRSFAVPPFMLAELEAAAPHIDRMNELRLAFEALNANGEQPTITQAFAMTRELVEILAIGIANCPDPLSGDEIAKQVNWTFLPSLQTAVDALLQSSGLASSGEVKAPAKGAKKPSRSR